MISGYCAIGSVKSAIAAGQRDDDRQHRGEDRPIDEEVRKHARPKLTRGDHGLLRAPAGADFGVHAADLSGLGGTIVSPDVTLGVRPRRARDGLASVPQPDCRSPRCSRHELRSARASAHAERRVLPAKCTHASSNSPRLAQPIDGVRRRPASAPAPNSVTPSMPLNTAVPSVCRISAPAPRAIISGTTPRMNAHAGHHDRPQPQPAGFERGLAARFARRRAPAWRTRRSKSRSCWPGPPAPRIRSA